MLFDIDNVKFESERERNLYYKFFAGYFFNELVTDIQVRLNCFKEMIQEALMSTGKAPLPEKSFLLDNTHISFDNHAYSIIGNKSDKGEFADVMIYDKRYKYIIAIEVKYLTNYKANKDVVKNIERLEALANELKWTGVVPCLLLTNTKNLNAKRKINQTGSNYKKLLDYGSKGPVVLEWERFLDCCADPIVKEYLKYQLRRKIIKKK